MRCVYLGMPGFNNSFFVIYWPDSKETSDERYSTEEQVLKYFHCSMYNYLLNLIQEHLTVNAEVLDSIPASSVTLESERRQV
jgi:hypothetical protein